MTTKKKTLNEMDKLEKLIAEYGQMETMRMIGYVSVMPIYQWRKQNKIPHWAKAEINKVYKEKRVESN